MLWIDGFDELPDAGEAAFLTSTDYLFASGISHLLGRGDRGRSVRLSGPTAALSRALDAQTDLIIGMGFKYENALSVDNVVLFQREVGGSIETIGALERNLSNGLQFSILGTVLPVVVSPANVVQQDVFNYIEVRVLLNDAASRVVVKSNNEQIIDHTFDGTGLTMDRIAFDKKASGNHILDDLYILNTSGSENADFLGDCFVENIALSGNGSPIEWTPFGGALNYSNINETGAADELKYNVSNVVGARDMFQVSDLNILVDQIFAVMVGVRAKKIGSGATTLRSVVNLGVTDTLGAPWSPDADFKTKFSMYSATPSGTAWTIGDFNSINIGYEIVT
jgi:hypothetical protein